MPLFPSCHTKSIGPPCHLPPKQILSVTTFPHPQCHHPGPSHHNDPPGCFAVASLLVSVFLPSLPLQPSLNLAATVFLSCKANHVSPPENSPIAKAKVLTRTYKALHDLDPSTSLPSSPMTVPYAACLFFFKRANHIPVSGPLHLLFPLPEVSFPRCPRGSSRFLLVFTFSLRPVMCPSD